MTPGAHVFPGRAQEAKMGSASLIVLHVARLVDDMTGTFVQRSPDQICVE
jgi:hypothetical protein